MQANMTLFQAVETTANEFPNRIALQFMGKRISYKSLIDKINLTAKGLSLLGFQSGDIMTLCLPNIFETIYTFYAAHKLGVICHMVHPLTPVNQLKNQMIATNSKGLMIVDTFYDHYSSLLDDLNGFIILATPVDEYGLIKKLGYRFINRARLQVIKPHNRLYRFHELLSDQTPVSTVATNPKQTAVYLHSGGTSGTPKTIELSHYAINQLASNTDYILDEHNFENRHMLAVLPMFHGFGLCMGVHAMLCFGGVDTLMPKFKADDVIKLIKKNQINYVIGVPTLFEALLNNPNFKGPHLVNLKQAFVGGDYVSPTLKQRFNTIMSRWQSPALLLEGYGLTEVVTVCAVNTRFDNKEGTVGRALPGITIAIVDTETKAMLSVGDYGEIAVSGPTQMNGYLSDVEGTASTIKNYDGQSYVLTGDYGKMDGDGYVYFKQRLKRIIKVSGMPVLPSEIETLVSTYDHISEVAAVGVSDEQRGSRIRLFVTLKPGMDKLVSDAEIMEKIKSELSIYAVPKSITYLDQMPKTIIGKIDTRALESYQ